MDYFSAHFFKEGASKTAMYSLRKRGKIMNVTPAKLKQLLGIHIMMGLIPLLQRGMYWQRDIHFEISNAMPREERSGRSWREQHHPIL